MDGVQPGEVLAHVDVPHHETVHLPEVVSNETLAGRIEIPVEFV